MAKAQNAAKTEGRQETEGRQDRQGEDEALAGAISFKGRDGQAQEDGEAGKEAIRQAQKVEEAELRATLEAEIVRHERIFEDFTGGLCTVTPDLTPMQLHERRLKASRVQTDTDSLPSEYRTAIALLSEVKFVYPDAK